MNPIQGSALHSQPHLSTTGHNLPPPDGQTVMHPPHVAASSPSHSGGSGYSPNVPQTNGSHGENAHAVDKSNPLSGLMNPHPFDRPSQLAPETASSLGLQALDDNWFMPWICSTPGASGDVAPTSPNYGGVGYTGSHHQIPRALLPGDLSTPMPTSSNLWQHSLAAVQEGGASWASGLRRPLSRGPAVDHGVPPRPEIDESRAPRDTYGSHPLGLPPLSGQLTAEVRPRYGAGARESFTSTSDRDGVRRQSSNVDIEEIVSWSNVLSFLSLYHEHL